MHDELVVVVVVVGGDQDEEVDFFCYRCSMKMNMEHELILMSDT